MVNKLAGWMLRTENLFEHLVRSSRTYRSRNEQFRVYAPKGVEIHRFRSDDLSCLFFHREEDLFSGEVYLAVVNSRNCRLEDCKWYSPSQSRKVYDKIVSGETSGILRGFRAQTERNPLIKRMF